MADDNPDGEPNRRRPREGDVQEELESLRRALEDERQGRLAAERELESIRRARLAERQARLTERRARLDERQARLDSQAVTQGRYYAIIDRENIADGVEVHALWADVDRVQGTRQDFDALRRPMVVSRAIAVEHWTGDEDGGRIQLVTAYYHTADALTREGHVAATNATASRTSHPGTMAESKLWPTDIFGFRSNKGDVAHILPAGSTDSCKWWFTADWLIEGVQWDESARLKVIHGMKPAIANGCRLSHTGIKHLCTNKIKLACPGKYFDTYPCFVLVPILTAEDARNWNGTSYSAIALMGAWVGNENLQEIAGAINMQTGPAELQVAAEEIGPAQVQLATEGEVAIATGLLRTCLKAIHFAVKTARNTSWPGVNRAWLMETNVDMVAIPRNYNYSERVYKVTFKEHNQVEGGGHFAPDPILLATKSAINFAKRHGTALMEAAVEPEDDDEFSEGDEIEEERLLAWGEMLLRPPDDRVELARRLGQAVDS